MLWKHNSVFNFFFQKIAYFRVEFETRQKPETRLSKTRTRLLKSAKTRPEPEPDCPKPEPPRPRLSQTRSITSPYMVTRNKTRERSS